MLEKRYRRTKTAEDRLEWVRHERERHRIYRVKENSYWLTCISNNAGQSRKLWKAFSSITGIDQLSKTALESPSAQDLLDFFIKKVADIRKSTGCSDPMTRLPPSSSKFESFRTYTVDEVRRLMMSTKPKSCSLDPIPTSILFEFMDDLLPFITSMCNKSLLEGQLPLCQRHALVTPILKKDGLDAINVQNYRPISNLTYISKLVERMVCQQLTGFLDESGLLPKLQSGFRARHSTETATLRVLSDVLATADRRGVTLLGLLDMSAAFDTVDHSILLQRAEVSFGLSGTVLSWLTSFLDGRTPQVVLNGAASSVEKITSGVPQGSVLGPLLFLLYTADIPLIAHAFGLGVHCYADDGQLYLSGSAESSGASISVVVDCIAEMDRWMASNRLKLNADKTQFIWLGSRQQLLKVEIDSIQLGSGSVSLKSSVNNLGVIFDSQLSMRDHVRHVCRSCFYQLRQLRVVRRSLTFEASAQLVHAFINSRLDYCNSLLAGVGDQLIGRLQSVLRAAARLVLQKKKYDRISDDIRNKLHWLPIRQRISFKLCLLVFRCLRGEAPPYLSEMLSLVSDSSALRSHRSAARGDLIIPPVASEPRDQRGRPTPHFLEHGVEQGQGHRISDNWIGGSNSILADIALEN